MVDTTKPKLTHFKALVFDVYGTLCVRPIIGAFFFPPRLDPRSVHRIGKGGIYDALLPILTKGNNKWNKEEALVAFCAAEGRLQKAHPQMLYADILAKVHQDLCGQLAGRYLVRSHHINARSICLYQHATGIIVIASMPSLSFSQEDHIKFSQSIKDWPIFSDSTDALLSLSHHYKLVVLSNVDRHSFSFTQAKLEAGKFSFDQVCTAQDIGSYKPDPANLLFALQVIKENYGINDDQVLFTAQSLSHDHIPAQSLGMSSAWINREGAFIGYDDKAMYNFTFRTLGEMAEAVRNQLH
jgi:2-haloalkanoic acid dehalogenase type II